MKLLNFFKTKPEPELKNYNYGNVLLNNFTEYEWQSSNQFLSSYLKACPVFTATKLIADACCGIDIEICDETTDEFLDNHPFLDLLENPSPFVDEDLFIKDCISYFLLTGNLYIKIINGVNKKPIELQVINPNYISIIAGSDGWAGRYSINNSIKNDEFIRNGFNYDNIKNVADKNSVRNRFFNKDGDEIIHLRDFNPYYGSNNLVGCSSFAGCEIEIAQYILSSQHNYSFLKNQGRPSGILKYKGGTPLTDDLLNSVKTNFIDKMNGSNNVGKPIFLGADFDWMPLSESIKDMDFHTLKKSVTEAIFNAVKIPLPMIASDNMSYANMDSSKYMFYDNAVLPVFKKLLEFLEHKILKPYYLEDNQDYSIDYDETEIEALEARKVDNALKIVKTESLSINEIRAIIGYDKLVEGGDAIYQKNNLTQIGNSGEEPSDIITNDNQIINQEKAQYIKLMSQAKDSNGNRLYSDELIKKNLEIYYV